MEQVKSLYKNHLQGNNDALTHTKTSIYYAIEILRECRTKTTYQIDAEPLDNKIAELEKAIFGFDFTKAITEDGKG